MEVVTESERPDLEGESRAAFTESWPEFIHHDAVTRQYIDRTQRYFPRLDILLLDQGRVVAGGWGVALAWNGTTGDLPDGYDGALVRAVEGHEAGAPAETLCLMAIVVGQAEKRRGLAGSVIGALRQRGIEQGLRRVIAPLRPTMKRLYPLASMKQFARWTRADGQHLDPWVRTHLRLGATILGPAPRSQVVQGSVADWEQWTGMDFPESGRYVVPEALGLVDIDCATDRGTYVEENLWVRHA